MQEVDLAAVATRVLWAAFALSFVFGAIAQRTHFCTMGAVADIVAYGSWARMRMWLLSIGTAMLGFNLMVALGWLDAADSIYAAPRLTWLSAVVGGLMFGAGMVLASGCGSKALVRAGGGSLKAFVVLLVLGVTAFATLRGITAVLRVNTVDQVALALSAGQDLPSLVAAATGAARGTLALAVGLLIGGGLVAWSIARPEGRSADVLLGGFGIGLVIVGVWWASGRLGYVPEDPNTLEEVFVATNSRRMEALSFVSPVAYALDWLLFFSDKSKLLTIGIVSTAGVLLGSAAWALVSRSFRWEGFSSVEDTASHMAGAALMGVGGVTALGCTIGQGVSGLSTLALGSFVAFGAIVAGAVVTLRWQIRRIDRMA
jgi:uncharacterized membrane protein YedE/YeeE